MGPSQDDTETLPSSLSSEMPTTAAPTETPSNTLECPSTPSTISASLSDIAALSDVSSLSDNELENGFEFVDDDGRTHEGGRKRSDSGSGSSNSDGWDGGEISHDDESDPESWQSKDFLTASLRPEVGLLPVPGLDLEGGRETGGTDGDEDTDSQDEEEEDDDDEDGTPKASGVVVKPQQEGHKSGQFSKARSISSLRASNVNKFPAADSPSKGGSATPTTRKTTKKNVPSYRRLARSVGDKPKTLSSRPKIDLAFPDPLSTSSQDYILGGQDHSGESIGGAFASRSKVESSTTTIVPGPGTILAHEDAVRKEDERAAADDSDETNFSFISQVDQTTTSGDEMSVVESTKEAGNTPETASLSKEARAVHNVAPAGTVVKAELSSESPLAQASDLQPSSESTKPFLSDFSTKFRALASTFWLHLTSNTFTAVGVPVLFAIAVAVLTRTDPSGKIELSRIDGLATLITSVPRSSMVPEHVKVSPTLELKESIALPLQVPRSTPQLQEIRSEVEWQVQVGDVNRKDLILSSHNKDAFTSIPSKPDVRNGPTQSVTDPAGGHRRHRREGRSQHCRKTGRKRHRMATEGRVPCSRMVVIDAPSISPFHHYHLAHTHDDGRHPTSRMTTALTIHPSSDDSSIRRKVIAFEEKMFSAIPMDDSSDLAPQLAVITSAAFDWLNAFSKTANDLLLQAVKSGVEEYTRFYQDVLLPALDLAYRHYMRIAAALSDNLRMVQEEDEDEQEDEARPETDGEEAEEGSAAKRIAKATEVGVRKTLKRIATLAERSRKKLRHSMKRARRGARRVMKCHDVTFFRRRHPGHKSACDIRVLLDQQKRMDEIKKSLERLFAKSSSLMHHTDRPDRFFLKGLGRRAGRGAKCVLGRKPAEEAVRRRRADRANADPVMNFFQDFGVFG